jgi:hypothetical protein
MPWREWSKTPNKVHPPTLNTMLHLAYVFWFRKRMAGAEIKPQNQRSQKRAEVPEAVFHLYPNQVAYVLKCTVRHPVVFYFCRQRASAELRTCIPSLPPNSYSRNIAYLVSSCKQEAVIAADRNRQSGSNGGGDRDGNGDGDSGKEDDEGDGGGGNSNGDCDSSGSNDEDNGSNSAGGGHKQQSTKYREENVAGKAMAAVRR